MSQIGRLSAASIVLLDNRGRCVSRDWRSPHRIRAGEEQGRKWVVAIRHGAVWLESRSWRFATGRFGWKVGRGDSPRVGLARKWVVAICHGSVRLETEAGGLHRGQSGWKSRLVEFSVDAGRVRGYTDGGGRE